MLTNENFEYNSYINNRNNLKPTKHTSLNSLTIELVKEGNAILEMEEKTKNAKKTSVAKQNPNSVKTNKPIQKSSKNPYLLAREQVLANMANFKRMEILEMENTGNTNNRFYEDFLKEVQSLGDSLSNN